MKFVNKIFAVNPYCSYKFFSQSTKNSRGVGILVKKSLNFDCLDTERDLLTDNFLLLRASLQNQTVIIGAIYGQNKRDDDFYNRLNTSLERLGDVPIILGGDWNATFSCLPVLENPDVLFMQDVPNSAHSKKIREICNNFELYDPFRTLFPNRKDFSYSPWGSLRRNRSRLDFFLVSKNIMGNVEEYYIGNNTLSKDEIIRENTLRQIGICFKKLRDMGPDPEHIEYAHADLMDVDVRTRLRAELRLAMDELDELYLPAIDTRMEEDEFLELMINNIRNEVISYQSFITKTITKSFTALNKKIMSLKQNFEQNFTEICELELKLREINEIKINSILEKNPNFDTIHSERITPFFLKMAKGYQHESTMSDICNHEGEQFLSPNERKNFIRDHFANSYKKPHTEPDNLQGCIEQFLGEEILRHPLVQNLKLDINEKIRLEQEISRDELDLALDGANSSSAAGIDGISTKFIKRYWDIFRELLFKYARAVFAKGHLTRTFRTAIIKLIPKKGIATDIRKWRPISLLTCMYKILSCAVNNRLKSVVNRFTSRAQKGFTNHRYIQEVLINVCTTINYCNLNNVDGALLSIDQSRAFDTISHKYMSEVYRFFGFGDEFINIMDTIGTGRTASIIYDDGSLSPEFDLETGRPQGDGPSPLQYNMGEEIVLLKIELDPRVRSVYQHNLLPRFAMDLVPDPRRKGIDIDYNVHFSQASHRETDKADGFADDNSTATEANIGSLQALKDICTEFSGFTIQRGKDDTFENWYRCQLN
jgi:exonuclease III